MALAFAQAGFDDPDPVPLVAQPGRVEMTGTKTETAKPAQAAAPAKPAVATQPKLDAVRLSDTGK